jgi:hypothetical protein
MRTRIADELQIDATTYSVEIDRAIFSAIEFYNDDDYWFLETTPATIIFTLTTDYTLSTSLPGRSQISDIVPQWTTVREPLLYRGLSELLGYNYDDNFTGDPLYYTVNADVLILRPKPSRTLTAQVWYSLRQSMTASASASSVWTNEAEELIRLTAQVDILENRIKDYDEGIKKRGRLSEIRSKLEEKTVKRRGSRRIRPFM